MLDQNAHEFASTVRADVHATLHPQSFLSSEAAVPANVAAQMNVAGDVAYARYLIQSGTPDHHAILRTQQVLAAIGIEYDPGSRIRV